MPRPSRCKVFPAPCRASAGQPGCFGGRRPGESPARSDRAVTWPGPESEDHLVGDFEIPQLQAQAIVQTNGTGMG